MRPLPCFCAVLLLAASACGGPVPVPVLARVEPGEIAAAIGCDIVVHGANLGLVRTIALSADGSQLGLLDFQPAPDGASATARVPAGMPVGSADLLVAGDFPGPVRLAGAVRVVDGELQIEAGDVGQGDATLVRAPGGRSLLVDGGRAKVAGGADSAVPWLAARGVRPDLLLASHFDADHLGGLVDWLRGPDTALCTGDDRVPAGGLFDYTREQNTCNSDLCVDYYRLRTCLGPRLPGGGSFVPQPGERLPLGGGVVVTVAAINGKVMDGTVVATGSDNANSIALLVEFGRFRYLTTGDLTAGEQPGCPPSSGAADVETPLGRAVGRLDVLHAGHHGACTSTGPALLAAAKPAVALVSAGLDNPFGHPSQDVLDRLSAAGARVFLTSAGQTGGGSFPATRLPSGAEKVFGHLRVVTADGEGYRVEVLDRAGSVRLTRPFQVPLP